MAEMKAFVLCVTFLLLYASLLGTVPTGLLTTDVISPELTGTNPQSLSGFTEYVQYDSTNYSGGSLAYTLGSLDWVSTPFSYYRVGVKRYVWLLWVSTDYAVFTAADGGTRGDELTLAEVDADAENGTVRYTATHGQGASAVVFSWNTTAYPTAANAWGNDSLAIVHGTGFNPDLTGNVLSLLFGLLTLSLPDVPFLLQVLLSTPLYASILYLMWFLVKEVLPFV